MLKYFEVTQKAIFLNDLLLKYDTIKSFRLIVRLGTET